MADTPHLTIRCEYPDTDMKVRYAMDLHPEEAYEYQSASSPLALIYAKGEGDDDGTYAFTHRTIIMAEADSLAENGPAGSAIRSLVEDNEMVYKTLIDQKPVTINKKGPTGLITTGIRPLPCQLSTRLLEVHRGRRFQPSGWMAEGAGRMKGRPEPDHADAEPRVIRVTVWKDMAAKPSNNRSRRLT